MAANKFKALVHYIIHRCRDNPGQLGAVRLNKILWFSDAFTYQIRGEPITSSTYIKRQFGPVPRQILPTLRELESEGKIMIIEPEHPLDTRKYMSLVAPAEDEIPEEELRMVTPVMNFVLGHTANAVSEASHDLIWESASEGEEIPLYATLASERGVLTEEIAQWAINVVRDRG